MVVKKLGEKIVLVAASFLGLWGVQYISALSGGDYFTKGAISVLMFAGVFLLLKVCYENIKGITDSRERGRRICFVSAVSLLFAITCVMGWQLQTRGLTECGVVGKGKILLISLCLSFVVLPFANGIFALAEILQKKDTDSAQEGEMSRCAIGKRILGLRNGTLFMLCWGFIFLLFLPVFGAYYPGVMGYDFNVQSIQALGDYANYNAHHPLLHTWLISLVLRLGEYLGSYQTGIAIYSVAQMLLLSAALAYACVMVKRLTNRAWPVVLSVLFFGLLPYHSVFAVSITKDVIFSALFLVFFLLWMERNFFVGQKKPYELDALLVIVGAFMIAFRNNAIYALAMFGALAVVMSGRRERLRVFLLCTAVLVSGVLGQVVIRSALGTGAGEVQSEKYSVPMQQFARVGYFHGEELSPEVYEMVDRYVSKDYWEGYNAPLADTVKLQVAGQGQFAKTWSGNLGTVFSDWMKVGLQYPNEYLDAFGQLTRGYWFVDDVSFTYVYDFEEDRKGVIPTFNGSQSFALPEGIENQSVFSSLYEGMERWIQENKYFEYPVVSLLFRPAFYCWILTLLCMVFVYTKQKEKLLLLCLPLCYLATLLLGPTVQARYVYPFMVLAPVLLSMLVRIPHNEQVQEVNIKIEEKQNA